MGRDIYSLQPRLMSTGFTFIPDRTRLDLARLFSLTSHKHSHMLIERGVNDGVVQPRPASTTHDHARHVSIRQTHSPRTTS